MRLVSVESAKNREGSLEGDAPLHATLCSNEARFPFSAKIDQGHSPRVNPWSFTNRE